MLKKGSVMIYPPSGSSDLARADIKGVESLHIETQEDLDRIHRLVAEGKPIPTKPAPGSKPSKR